MLFLSSSLPRLVGLWVFLAAIAFAQQTIQVTGEAAPAEGQPAITARQLAITEGLRQAVEDALGVFLTSQTVVEKQQVIEDRITKHAEGFARVEQVIQEGPTPDGTYKVELRVVVDSKKLNTTLRSVMVHYDDPRILVVTSPSSPMLQGVLTRELIKLGFRTVTLSTRPEESRLSEAAQGMGADLVLLADFSFEDTSDEPLVKQAGLKGQLLQFSARLEDVLTRDVLWAQSFSAGGLGLTAGAAQNTAALNLWDSLWPDLRDDLTSWIQAAMDRSAPTFQLRILLSTPATASALAQSLEAQTGVRGVTVRKSGSSESLLEIEYAGKNTALTTLLDRLGYQVIRVQGRQLTLQRKKP